MSSHRLDGPPPPELARALADFEAQFHYPLGPGRWFRISHGEDYTRFFRAIGDATCCVVERQGQVLGCLAVAWRRLAGPDGDDRMVAYIADLKIAKEARGGVVLMRLVREARAVVSSRATAGEPAAFAVVMDGTAVTPPAYTGRAGIPQFLELGKIDVLRIQTAGSAGPRGCFHTSEETVQACYRELTRGGHASRGGTPGLRSEMEPAWLATPDGSACGLLEDTRRAKRLIASDGLEMLSAHLSYFAYHRPADGRELLKEALALAASRGLPALFVAVPAHRTEELCGDLRAEVVVAPATVYGTGHQPGPAWSINTAEI
jgi:hypothetical protein